MEPPKISVLDAWPMEGNSQQLPRAPLHLWELPGAVGREEREIQLLNHLSLGKRELYSGLPGVLVFAGSADVLCAG